VFKTALTIKVEQMCLEINMHSFNALFAHHGNCLLHQSSTNPTPLPSRMYSCVEDERMHAAIPGKINEANMLIAGIRTHERQTLPQQRIKIPWAEVGPSSRKQRIELMV
jgi:hypothetical protein